MDTAVYEDQKPRTRRRPDRRGPDRAADLSELIARRAYELYLARGGEHGRDIEDWLRAENELANRRRNARRTQVDAD